MYQIMVYCGVALMAAAAVAGAVAVVAFVLRGRALRRKMEGEFGKKGR